MRETQVLDLARHAIVVALQLSLPILILSLVIGVMVSLFQAVTQIQEQTLTFVPKLLALSLALIFLGPWMLHTIVGFTAGLFAGLPNVIH
ncbi:MAG: flagellar biosynthesis protein FliQ [Armatimonadetes bacterium]|nr:flagellar biosynthesis protein FliQ [Armatimonadota bacterium]